MPTCREVSRAVATDELERAGLWQRLGVRFHLLMCRHCRRYSEQLRAIGQATRELFREEPAEQATVERLREAIRRGRKADADD
jgi:predicted anti-sigma-YlaC factor YlaD